MTVGVSLAEARIERTVDAPYPGFAHRGSVSVGVMCCWLPVACWRLERAARPNSDIWHGVQFFEIVGGGALVGVPVL